MTPRLPCRGLRRFNAPFTTVGRAVIPPPRRHASQSSPSPSPSASTPPPTQRRWLRLVFVTAAAAGVGALFRSQQGPESSTLNAVTFTPYCLVSRESVSSTGSFFTLRPPKSDGSNHEVYEDAWRTGVWSVMFKQPQLQIGREYTPLPSTSSDVDGDDDECLRFFIRKDPFGEVSRYLHSLDIGTPVEVRGPRIECEIPPETQQILFIAGGTGIAPALQAGHTLLRRTNQAEHPKIHIMWANRRREDCAGGMNDSPTTLATPQTSWFSSLKMPKSSPPSVDAPKDGEASLIVRELEALRAQYPGQVTVDYFVDEEGTGIGKQSIWDSTNTALSSVESGRRNLILVSGPEGFISYMAGPKLWAEGMELQGPLRGILKELDLKDWAVWKL